MVVLYFHLPEEVQEMFPVSLVSLYGIIFYLNEKELNIHLNGLLQFLHLV